MQHVDEFVVKAPSQQEADPITRSISLLLNIILMLVLVGLATLLGVGVMIGIMLVW